MQLLLLLSEDINLFDCDFFFVQLHLLYKLF